MNLVKSLNGSITHNESYAVYELSDYEINASNAPGKYLLSQKYSDYAMTKMDKIDIIRRAIRDSEFTYGVAFCDTIKEAELYLKCCILECQLNSVKGVVKRLSDNALEALEEKVSVFID